RPEEPPADGAEEGLDEFRIGDALDAGSEVGADAHPEGAVFGLRAEQRPQLRDGMGDETVVELDALHRIALAALPVAGVEPHGRAPRNRPELRVVFGEGAGDPAGCERDGVSQNRSAAPDV